MRKLHVLTALALAGAAAPIAAQDEPPIPDPATVTLPDLTSANDPQVAKDGHVVDVKTGKQVPDTY